MTRRLRFVGKPFTLSGAVFWQLMTVLRVDHVPALPWLDHQLLMFSTLLLYLAAAVEIAHIKSKHVWHCLIKYIGASRLNEVTLAVPTTGF